MNPMQLYITTCRYVMQANYREPREWEELYRFLPFLRQSLSCYVCFNVVHQPMGPVESACSHHCCKDCVGGKMRTKPSCSWCKDFEQFEENQLLGLLVKCFKKMCHFIASSPSFQAITSTTMNGGTNNILTIVQEGLAVPDEDILDSSVNSNLSLPPPVLSRAPSIAGQDNPETQRQVSCSTDTRSSVSPVISETQLHTVMHDYAIKPTQHIQSQVQDRNISSATCNVSDTECTKYAKKMKVSAKKKGSAKVTGSKKNTRAMQVDSDICGAESNATNSLNKSYNTYANLLGNAYGPPALPLEIDQSLDNQSQLMNNGIHLNSVTSTSTSDGDSKAKSPKRKKIDKDKKGCRCGNATANPGKLTCYGQRCPCYSTRLACADCCCRGCRNPYKVAVKIEPLALTDEDLEITVV